MNYLQNENVILQGGCIICPICHSKNNWNYKRDLMFYASAFSDGITSSEHSDNPNNYPDFILNSDNKIRFIICCQQCHVKIETEYMELINKENYEKYKVIK